MCNTCLFPNNQCPIIQTCHQKHICLSEAFDFEIKLQCVWHKGSIYQWRHILRYTHFYFLSKHWIIMRGVRQTTSCHFFSWRVRIATYLNLTKIKLSTTCHLLNIQTISGFYIFWWWHHIQLKYENDLELASTFTQKFQLLDLSNLKMNHEKK